MSGQIIKREEGVFLVRIYMGRDAGGKRRYHNKTIHGNKKDAERYRNKVLRERDIGTFVEPSKESLTEYLDNWLELVVKRRVKEKTYLDYSDRLRLYVKPVLGNLRLEQVRPEKIQYLYNNMLEKGLSTRSVKYVHTILKNALKQAVKWGKIYHNPADLVDLPRQKKEEMKVLTPSQAAYFMEIIVYSPWKALFSLLLASGMRPGEALGLKWTDLDFDNMRVTINRSLTRIRYKGWELDEPKTTRSRRTIPLPSVVIEDLEEHRERQLEIKNNMEGTEYKEYNLVFPASNGMPMSETNLTKRYFKPLIRDAGLPDIRLYDLRHTCATLLLAAGENPKIVSERLGHSSVTLTLDTYSHVLPDMQEAATEKLEGMLFNAMHTKKK